MKKPKNPVKLEEQVIIDMFKAGDNISLIAWDYNMQSIDVENIIRRAMKK